MKIKLISDGTVSGTKLVNADTGEDLKLYPFKIDFSIDAYGKGTADMVLRLELAHCDITAIPPGITVVTANAKAMKQHFGKMRKAAARRKRQDEERRAARRVRAK